MKGILYFSMGLFLLAGCSGGDGKGAPTGADGGPQASVFADTSLEAAVRQALKQPTGALRSSTLAGLSELEARERGIVSLKGIESLPNLVTLDLADNQIEDLAPLASLSKLRSLDLDNNRVRDLTPLAGLSQLEVVVLAHNAVQDLTPLLALSRLTSAELSGNPLNGGVGNPQLAALQSKGVVVNFQAGGPSSGSGTPAGPVYTLALVAGPEGKADIFLVKTDGSEPVNLTQSPGLYGGLAWSPGGSTLAFVWDDDPFDVGFNVFVMDADGGKRVKLTNRPGSYQDLSWSPDGQQLICSYRQHIYAINADGSGMKALTTESFSTELDGDRRPAWSPDGSRIAFARVLVEDLDPSPDRVAVSLASYYVDIYTMNEDGSSAKKITGQPIRGSTTVSWSPGGDLIAFSQGPDEMPGEQQDIYLVDARGGNPENLTQSPATHEETPIWSPDGSRIAFVSFDGSDAEIYAMNADGSNPINLSRDASSLDDHPKWSPDGEKVAYIRQGETIDLYLADVKGSLPQSLTDQELELKGVAAYSGGSFAWRPR